MEDTEKSTALAQANPKDSWVLLQRQCKAFIDSGYLPAHVKGMAQAVTIAWKGHELGIPPLQAFSSITVIKGKPCLSAELMLALIYQRVKGAKITFRTPPEKQHLECVVEMQRPGGELQPFRFSLDDAKRAGLVVAGSAWEKYPSAMLRARAVSAGARAVFPDAIMGCYTPEELGGEVVDAEFSIDPSPVPNRTPPSVEPPVTPIVQPAAAPKLPSQADYPRAHPNWENDPCTDAQRKKLWAMAKEVGYENNQLKDFLYSLYGDEIVDAETQDVSLVLLTKGRIQHVFKELESSSAKNH